jgi:DNA-binding LacI/PurR family transcriptional regulator
MEIPFDIPIGGFNDSEESRIFSPPLTTVHMPFSHQALCALRLLSEMRKGTTLPICPEDKAHNPKSPGGAC